MNVRRVRNQLLRLHGVRSFLHYSTKKVKDNIRWVFLGTHLRSRGAPLVLGRWSFANVFVLMLLHFAIRPILRKVKNSFNTLSLTPILFLFYFRRGFLKLSRRIVYNTKVPTNKVRFTSDNVSRFNFHEPIRDRRVVRVFSCLLLNVIVRMLDVAGKARTRTPSRTGEGRDVRTFFVVGSRE